VWLWGLRAVAPGGSGADVIASTLGGFVVMSRDAEGIDVEAFEAAPSFVWRVVWTGAPSRTSDLVAAVKAFATHDRPGYDRNMSAIDDASRAVIDAFGADEVHDGIAAVRLHHEALRALGEAAGVPIVTPALGLAATLAESEGGAAKPSGAGGGDVAIALFVDDASAERFEIRARQAGLFPISMKLGADGVRCEPAAVYS